MHSLHPFFYCRFRDTKKKKGRRLPSGPSHGENARRRNHTLCLRQNLDDHNNSNKNMKV